MSAEGPCAICLEESDDLTCPQCVEATRWGGERIERARIVAWLRAEARRVWDSYASSGRMSDASSGRTSEGNAIEAAALAIERGEHVSGESSQ